MKVTFASTKGTDAYLEDVCAYFGLESFMNILYRN